MSQQITDASPRALLVDPDALLSSKQLKQLVPVTDMTIWRWIQDRGFPAPIKLTEGGRNFWRAGPVRAWLAAREAAPLAPTRTPHIKKSAPAGNRRPAP
jgi:predicted DNA-binding transcriptional regulator AlpA